MRTFDAASDKSHSGEDIGHRPLRATSAASVSFSGSNAFASIVLMTAKIESTQAHSKALLIVSRQSHSVCLLRRAYSRQLHLTYRASASTHTGKGPRSSTVDKMINTLGFG